MATKSTEIKPLRAALAGSIANEPLSPENISTIPLYHIHYNLWDTLISTGNNAAIAKSFKISPDGKAYSFEIDPDAKFSNGRQITANDIKGSLERLIAREKNGHINAKSAISRIIAKDSHIDIELRQPTPSLQFLFTTPEFGIVPKESLNEKGEVANLTVTSGAFTVEKIDFEAQTLFLKKNPYFRRAASDAPERVELNFSKIAGIDSVQALVKKGYSFIEIFSSDADQTLDKLDAEGYEYQATAPSVSVFLVADPKLVSGEIRRFIARSFQTSFTFESRQEARSRQLFPPKTFGSLGTAEIPEISIPMLIPGMPREIIIQSARHTGALIDEIKRVFDRLGMNVRFIDYDSKEKPHYLFLSQGMNTDFPEIELHLSIMSPYAFIEATQEIKGLITKASHTQDDGERSRIIKKIGTELLSSGTVIPLTTRTYVHAVDPKIVELNGITKYDGDIPLYQLRMSE